MLVLSFANVLDGQVSVLLMLWFDGYFLYLVVFSCLMNLFLSKFLSFRVIFHFINEKLCFLQK